MGILQGAGPPATGCISLCNEGKIYVSPAASIYHTLRSSKIDLPWKEKKRGMCEEGREKAKKPAY